MSDAATDGGIYHNGRTYAEHCAWIDAMSPDEKLILYTAPGHRYTLVMISVTKRALVGEMPNELRLRFLEILDRISGFEFLSPEVVARIDPICDGGAEIVDEARKLGKKWLDKIAEHDVFRTFCTLNPSLLEELRMRENMRVAARHERSLN